MALCSKESSSIVRLHSRAALGMSCWRPVTCSLSESQVYKDIHSALGLLILHHQGLFSILTRSSLVTVFNPSSIFKIQFKPAVLLSAVAPLAVFALPTTQVDNGISTPAPEEWKTPLGWDGKVGPVGEVGHFISTEKKDGEATNEVVKRTPGGLYMCQAFNFRAPCWYNQWGNSGDCLVLSDYWRYTMSAVGLDPETPCYLYWSQDCTWDSSSNINNPDGNLQGANHLFA